ncbi:hypothetical protein B0O99DRAFT_684893 [Bisporella sp. PMI_857]|nr:hypothetical protein B0O99DRAFT_684893 [Bisporella sp. PMI_857]
MLEPQIVTFEEAAGEAKGTETLVSLVGATVLVDNNDFPGVKIAGKTLTEDFGRVTKSEASAFIVTYDAAGGVDSRSEIAIVIGSLEKSGLIQKLVAAGQVDVNAVRGKWESFCITVVERPICIKGCKKALVIAGSDKRGTIFGTYTLSEQIGVSPWYWWADVPPKYHKDIYALPVTFSSKEPSVKHRGIFINDEAPALTGFVLEKFGNYGKKFHIKVFELLLRLKANFMWPAMWPGYPNPGSSFFTDDPENQKTADEYGIVISTSHHEPMQRATNEWFEDNPDGSWSWLENKQKISQFFDEGLKRAKGRESYLTMGMRGEYDKSMKTDDPAGVVRDVIKTQRSLVKELYGCEDAVPQLLALYKEVQEYWDAGNLDVPDDVTLLFADDNFGTLRRLPSGREVDRPGGAGIYYHFEYVGHPRSYKWLNSNSLGKTWHQLREAHRRNAKQIWVFNVGDIKPMEVPLSLAMALAWDINSVQADSFLQFFETLAEREFGDEVAGPVAAAWHEYERLTSLRRHEHIEADSYSVLHYNEANTILSRWEALLSSVEDLYSTKISESSKPAFFQLLLHPIKASTIYTSLRIHLALNQHYALQRRTSANKAFNAVLSLFSADFALSQEFHSLLNGKWNHIMRQTHYGYRETWHAPSRDMISGLCYVQAGQDSNPLVGQMGVAVEGHAGVRPGVCNEESDRTHPSRRDLVPGVTLGAMTPYGPKERWLEVFSRGSIALNWTASSPYEWIKLSKTEGHLVPGEDDARILITVDWDAVPAGFNEEVLIDVRSTGGNYGPYGDDFEQIHLPIINRHIKAPFEGFVEADGHISVHAAGQPVPAPYYHLPEVGRSEAGSVSLDPSNPLPDVSELPFLTYNIYTFTPTTNAVLDLQFNMTLDYDPARCMEYDVQIDDSEVTTHRLVQEPNTKGGLPIGWKDAVRDCVWKRRHDSGELKDGEHVVKLRLRHENVLLEKVVLDLGGVKESYLGPPPSRYVVLK